MTSSRPAGGAAPRAGRSDLGTRLLVASVGIPVGFAVVWAGGWILAATLLVLALLGTHEVVTFARSRGARPFAGLALLASTVLLLLPLLPTSTGPQDWALPALGVILGTALLALAGSVFWRGPEGDPLAATAVTLLAPVYVAVPLAFGWFLRHHPAADIATPGWAGTAFLLLPMIATWLGDTTAYFGGKTFGTRKLLPSVSPAKTREGALSGLVGSVLGAVFVAGVLIPVSGGGELLTVPAAALLGLLVGAVAQVGDLAESALKREAGLKDSGTILPGHGGVLDRFDAVLFTLPLTWLLLPLFLGWSS